MPFQREDRTQVVALAGVVVDHVEDHLDAGLVEGLDHLLELLHLPACTHSAPSRHAAAHRVLVVRREVRQIVL